LIEWLNFVVNHRSSAPIEVDVEIDSYN